MKNIYMIGNAHIDPVWQWKYDEGFSTIKSTYKAALDRMGEFKDYVFTSACASYYELMKESEPEMFSSIAQLVKEGRWDVTGNMWVQPDCNIPSGESFCRHMLYSQRFFLDNFGFYPKSGYNVDSFGHNGSLPQILKKSGMESYVYLRPSSDFENKTMTKERLHLWVGNDGSEVLCNHIPDAYCGLVNIDRLSLVENEKYPGLFFYGVGNHGGGPTIAMLEEIEKMRKEEPGRYIYGSIDRYFDECRKEVDISFLDKVEGDLQHHASGCYSANSKIKYLNRRAENLLSRAEKMDVLSSVLTGSYPHPDDIKKAWKSLMFNQFHDILAGCAIYEAYEDAYDGMNHASYIASNIESHSNERITWRIDTTPYFRGESEMRDRLWVSKGEGSPVVVVNANSFPVKKIIKAPCPVVEKIIDDEGNEVAIQKTRASYTDGPFYEQYLFEAEVPAYGYKTYFVSVEKKDGPTQMDNEFKCGENSLENSVIKIEFSPLDGSIKGIIDKRSGGKLCEEGFAKCLLINDENSDTWAHGVFKFDEVVGAFSSPEFSLVEIGPLRATLKVVTKLGLNTLTQYFSLDKGCENIKVRGIIDFHEKHKIAKLSFPMIKEYGKVRYSLPYGYLEKSPNGEEEPMHKYVDVYGEEGGVGIANDRLYSASFENNELRMIIARGCAYLDHFGKEHRDWSMRYMDQGESEFNYEIVPHGKSMTNLIKESIYLNSPASFYKETHHKGDLPLSYSGLDSGSPSIIIDTIKTQEDGLGYIIRAYESIGEKAEASIDLKFLGVKINSSFSPFEFKTFFVSNDKKTIKEVLVNELI